MTRVELVEKSKHFFNNEEVKLVYATSDGHFYYEKFKNDAQNHLRGKDNVELFTITRAEALGKTKPKSSTNETPSPDAVDYTEEEFQALKEEWNTLSEGKTLNKRIKYSTLLEKVEALREPKALVNGVGQELQEGQGSEEEMVETEGVLGEETILEDGSEDAEASESTEETPATTDEAADNSTPKVKNN